MFGTLGTAEQSAHVARQWRQQHETQLRHIRKQKRIRQRKKIEERTEEEDLYFFSGGEYTSNNTHITAGYT